MTLAQIHKYQQAAAIARAIMGKKTATEDPLAWWCLTELLMAWRRS